MKQCEMVESDVISQYEQTEKKESDVKRQSMLDCSSEVAALNDLLPKSEVKNRVQPRS